jgi:hypothetical protein
VLPDDYTMTMANERFLISDPNEVKSACVFSSREQLICLSGSSSRFSDGNFKSSPREFLQNYMTVIKINQLFLVYVHFCQTNLDKHIDIC